MDVGGGPVHDLAQLIPVVHVGEVQIFHRSPGDDHAVVIPVFDLVKGGIEGGQMFRVGVLRDMAEGVEQLHLYLQGGVGQLPQQLSLGHDLRGHQIQDQQLQRADVLVHGPVLCHDKDIFALQSGGGGQRVGNFDWHGKDLFPI